VAQFSRWFLELFWSDAFVLMCVMFLIIGVLELIIPAHKIPGRHYRFNLAYAFINIIVITAVTPFISASAAYVIQRIGLGLIDLRALGFGSILGAFFALLISTLIFDFFLYWQHRLEHCSKILWQQHLLHHSDEYMNVTTATRQHLFENISLPLFVTMAVLFKLPPIEIAMLSLIPFAWQYFTHANIKFGFGPLWWLLTSPNYHRIHHSLERNHIDKNFVGWFPIWDIIFGTAVVPRRGECPPTGVANVSVRTLTHAYLLPFIGWRQMLMAGVKLSRSPRLNDASMTADAVQTRPRFLGERPPPLG